MRSLVALRVSAKSDDTAAGVIGRYGVGFTATATIANHVEDDLAARQVHALTAVGLEPAPA